MPDDNSRTAQGAPAPVRTTSDLLAAERALGRLVQQVEDAGDLAEALAAEAMRRDAWASLQLDGDMVHLEDIATAQISLGLLPGAKYDGANRALGLLRTAEAMARGLTEGDAPPPVASADEDHDELHDIRDLADEDEDLEDDDVLPGSESIEDAMAAARAATADLEAFLAGGMGERRRDEGQGAAPRRLAPLSGPWMAKTWRLAFGAPGEREAEALERATTDVDAALSSRPGLAGVALALNRLHADGYWPQDEARTAPDQLRDVAPDLAGKIDLMLAERQAPGPGWAFNRLIAPWVVGRACELDGPAPWLSEPLLLRRAGYARAPEMREAEWERWLCGALAGGWTLQRYRLPEMRARLEKWRRTCQGEQRPGRGGGRRPGRGGPLAVLPILAAQPVVTPEWLARRLSVSDRAAQMTLGEMAKLGVVRELTGGYTHRVYEAVG